MYFGGYPHGGAGAALAHHAALVTGLAYGTLSVRKAGGDTQRWAVSGGFFEVSNNRATVLADGVGPEAPAR